MDCRGVIAMSAVVNLEQKPLAVRLQNRIRSGGEFSATVQSPVLGVQRHDKESRHPFDFNSLNICNVNRSGLFRQVGTVNH